MERREWEWDWRARGREGRWWVGRWSVAARWSWVTPARSFTWLSPLPQPRVLLTNAIALPVTVTVTFEQASFLPHNTTHHHTLGPTPSHTLPSSTMAIHLLSPRLAPSLHPLTSRTSASWPPNLPPHSPSQPFVSATPIFAPPSIRPPPHRQSGTASPAGKSGMVAQKPSRGEV